MIELGMFLYVMFVVIAVMFWRATRGPSFEDLFERATHVHHHVHRVVAKHPTGGSWPDHKRWMQEEADSHD